MNIRNNILTPISALVLIGPSLSVSAKDVPAQLPAVDGKLGNSAKPVKVYILSGQSNMVGMGSRLITCLARWNGQDATKVVPEALEEGIGLYGFPVPRNNGGLVPLAGILFRPVSELQGDDRNIAVLALAFNDAPIDSVSNRKRGFIESGK